MKRIDIKNIKECLDGIKKGSIKFLIVIEKNKQLLTPDYITTKAIYDLTYLEEYREVEEERVRILKEYSNKDANGEAIVKGNNYDLDKTKSLEFQEAITNFSTKYKEEIKIQEERLKEVESFLNEEIDINLLKINLEEFPDEYISLLETLECMVD